MKHDQAFSMKFSAEMDARPRIYDDLVFWHAHRAHAGMDEERRLIARLSDEYLDELEKVTPIVWLKACLAAEIARRQGGWFGSHGKLSRSARRFGMRFRLIGQRARDELIAMRTIPSRAQVRQKISKGKPSQDDSNDEQNTHLNAPVSQEHDGPGTAQKRL